VTLPKVGTLGLSPRLLLKHATVEAKTTAAPKISKAQHGKSDDELI
jgi:hypothetical protein